MNKHFGDKDKLMNPMNRWKMHCLDYSKQIARNLWKAMQL